MGKYQAYMEYKDFESVFLTEIPASWEVKPLHTLCDFRQGKAHEPFVDGDGQFICVNARFVSTQGHSAKRCTENLTPAYLHDVLMVMSDLPNGRALARAFYVEEKKDYAVNQRICAITAKKICAKFLFYQLDRSPYFLMYDDGSNQTHLSNDTYKKYPVLLPSVSEQQIIANFLDHETAKIDILIEKQQQLIVLLKEKRQTVISHAVTKGLNANAPMRDSGVEWLGEVPEHWEVKRLKNTSEVVDCRNKTPEYFEDGDYLVVRTTNIKKQKLSMNGALYTNEASFKIWTQRGVPPAGSIFFTREAPAGEVCLVPDNLKFCMGQRMMNFICHEQEYTSYLFDYLLSDCLERYIASVSHGSTVSHLRVEQVENIPVIVPPPSEAKEIHEELSVIKAKYLKLTDKAEQTIELMKERRTALISAAVTGKIDVRNWATPEIN
jgi:type I restriction enzyme S subunit